MLKLIKRWFRRPASSAGNVYYVRLKTPQGTFYKLGYTSKSSLRERLAFGGHGDEALIDQEFFFTHRSDAWDVEQTLLEHFDKQRTFGKFSNRPDQPLPGRGQSELFREDVLGLDEDVYRYKGPPLTSQQKEALDGQMLGIFLILVGIVAAFFTLGIGLIAAFFGWMSINESSEVSIPSRTGATRPTHPPRIRALIDELKGRREAA